MKIGRILLALGAFVALTAFWYALLAEVTK